MLNKTVFTYKIYVQQYQSKEIMNKIIILLLSIALFSCKAKSNKIITDKDVNRNERGNYKYKDGLTKKELKYFAEKLHTKKEFITNTKLYVFVKSWEQTTYLYGGINKNGVDCSALMVELYSYVYNENLPRTSGEMYSDDNFRAVKANETLQEGDLVFFKIDQTKIVSHVGIYLKNDRFFSASSTEGCNITPLFGSDYWKKFYVGASRLKK